ncbi:putative sugar transporter [Halosimplex carlsbadense 2-9-1]|uniref:Putative sugar transporter n=1 Tax=Halosimplex carlsbadense 2-9-1 TaxID=797114 RepID=M0CKB4_9EURY|nr:MFS transporter [Halosimplex carlsbadense]ELZ23681.1 putative sugar transporter [Halosimplex carlsbadense 2-9-1]
MNGNDRAITGIASLAHGAVHTYEMTIPLFVVVWLTEFDAIPLGVTSVDVTTATVGVVVTLGYGLFGLGALPGGILVDRVGSRRLISACLLGMGLSYVLLGLAPNMLVVAAALVLWGIAASVYHPAGLSLISKGVEERGTGLAYHGMAGNLGIGLGPLAATVMLLFVEWRTVALVLGAPAVLAAVYAARADFDETAAVAESGAAADGGSKATSGVDDLGEFLAESRRLLAGGFVLVFVVVMCSGLYYRGVLTFLPELLRDLPGFEPISVDALLPESVRSAFGVEPGAGQTLKPQDYFYSGLLLVGVVGQYAGGKLTDRMPVEYGLAGSFGVLAVLAVLFVPVSEAGLGPLVVLGALLGAFLFVVQPMYQATVAEYTPSGTRGLSYGFTYLGVFGVGALGGTIAGGILAVANATALFLVLAGIAAVGSVTGLVLARRAG